MSTSSIRENYVLHKIHSLTGIVPIGYYLLQHLALNSFSLAGPKYFNGVIEFFEGMPLHILLMLEVFVIWIPLLFHAIYGMCITSRAMPNITKPALRYRENWMYTFQRLSGIFIFLFLCYHVASTSIYAKIYGIETIKFAAWHQKLTSYHYFFLYFYMLGVFTSAYHFSYGLWNFCIRWGLTITAKSQLTMQKVSALLFIMVTVLGWSSLFGFIFNNS